MNNSGVIFHKRNSFCEKFWTIGARQSYNRDPSHNRPFSLATPRSTMAQHAQPYRPQKKEKFLHKYKCNRDCIDFLNALIDSAHTHLSRIVVCENRFTIPGYSPHHAHCAPDRTQRRSSGRSLERDGASPSWQRMRTSETEHAPARTHRSLEKDGLNWLCIDSAEWKLLFRIDNWL